MSEALRNEIHAYFGKLTTTTTKKVSQWAYGQKLIVHDDDLPSVFEAYYSNSRSRGEAKPQIGTDGEVSVPDEYFISGADIYVFLMEHEGADDGRYRKIVHIPIDPCSKPVDVEPTPQEQSVIDQAIAALNSAVGQTAADVISADASAQAAAQSAEEAQTAATQAQGSATSASGSATTASTKAYEAALSASEAVIAMNAAQEAAETAETAQGLAEDAQTAAERAAASIMPTDPTLSIMGRAADSKATGDAIKELQNGGYIADQQRIEEKINDWLDDHPEATTTVQDGAITLPKLNDSLKADLVITDTTEQAYFHDVSPSKVAFYPSTYTQGVSAKYAGSENLFNDVPFDTYTTSGFTRSQTGRFINVVGTGTGGFQMFNTSKASVISKLKGKLVNIYVYISKQTAWEKSSYFAIRSNGTTTLARQNYTPTSGMRGWVAFENVQMPDDLTSLRLYFNDVTNVVFSEGDFYTAVAYETQVVDTEQVITGEDALEYPVSGLNYIDTVMHESTAETVVPTKEYIDNHIPDITGFWTESVYALPEHFGAVGDGVTDDSSAIAACLAYAVQTGKAVKGYRTYKVTTPIVIDYNYSDVYLKNIVYSGNESAVMIKNMNAKFGFYSITSNGIGLHFAYNSDATVKYARYCLVNGFIIESDGDCIFAERGTLYNTIEVRKLVSSNGNCIEFATESEHGMFNAGEYVFRSSSCSCRNGYAICNTSGSKFYDFTIESNCKYGLLNPQGCVCIGFRHREQLDAYARSVKNGDNNNGPFLTFTRNPSGSKNGFKYISSDGLNPWSIDLSAIQGYAPIESGIGQTEKWFNMGYTGIFMDTPISGTGIFNVGYTAYAVAATKVCFIGNNKVFVPEGRTTLITTESVYDYRLCESQNYADIIAANSTLWGTDFVIDADTTIYFNASFGAIGYNDLTVTQRNGHTAVIYDKLGNVLFDGTNEGDGKWSLKCFVDRSSCGRLQGHTYWWCYDGTNEIWEIEKIG